MLIEFSVENYKSIKDEQTLSLVKNSANEMPDNYFDPNAPATPQLLKTAVIYGANATGKSNLLKALHSMCHIIKNSFNKKLDEKINLEPFLFDPISRTQPTTFQITMIVKLPADDKNNLHAVKVEYGFSADQKQVYEEWLSLYPKGREQTWFHRLYNDDTQSYEWKDSNFFKGQKDTWKKNTRSDQLFLATAVHLNSAQLKPIYDAFTVNTKVIFNEIPNKNFSKLVCNRIEAFKKLTLALLQQADIDVENIVFEERKENLTDELAELPEPLKKEILRDFKENLDTYFVHSDSRGNPIQIKLENESDGTQKLFTFASLIFYVLSEGETLIVDEFNNSLHPDLIRFLVKMFNSPINTENAQLIFTTHETSVLRKDLLRRDQIWFCEKNKDKSTHLYPLTDFSPHKGREDIEESYLHGRYGGKPTIQDFIVPEDIEFSTDENTVEV